MVDDLVVIRKNDGFVIGTEAGESILPLIKFRDLEELRKFAWGLWGYCEKLSPSIPSTFIKAFEEEHNADSTGNSRTS